MQLTLSPRAKKEHNPFSLMKINRNNKKSRGRFIFPPTLMRRQRKSLFSFPAHIPIAICARGASGSHDYNKTNSQRVLFQPFLALFHPHPSDRAAFSMCTSTVGIQKRAPHRLRPTLASAEGLQWEACAYIEHANRICVFHLRTDVAHIVLFVVARNRRGVKEFWIYTDREQPRV
jgi:hypothetical protein